MGESTRRKEQDLVTMQALRVGHVNASLINCRAQKFRDVYELYKSGGTECGKTVWLAWRACGVPEFRLSKGNLTVLRGDGAWWDAGGNGCSITGAVVEENVVCRIRVGNLAALV